jgi:hypothetical protein
VKKRTPPQIPPLSDATLSRIERGLFAALDARPLEPARAGGARRRALVLAVAGVAAAGALFAGRVVERNLGRDAGREVRRGEGLLAHAAQISTTTSGSRIAITGATLEVAPQSAVSFGGGPGGAVVVVLDRGTVTCEVAPRSNRAPFIVEAGATRVTVIGTRFSVHREGEHATVSVEHGLVEVADTSFTELVHAGERYRPGEPITREPLPSEASTNATASAPPPAKTDGAATPPGSGVVPPAGARSVAPVVHERRRRLALAEGAAPAPAGEARVAEDAHGSSAPVASADDAGPAAPGGATAEKSAAQAPQRRSVQVLFELAAQLEMRDPEAALRIYGELAAAEGESSGGWAASALFAAARLEGERGHGPRARELAESYLQRFPQGPNADDARALLSSAR